MDRQTYESIERYMLIWMRDSAHDKDHVYRVLYNAMTIAKDEAVQDMDVLIAACLLHDVARPEQLADPSVCHAQAGGDKAYAFLRRIGWPEAQAEHVRQCIRSHRFRKSAPPETIEAKILYDADKLDVTGAIGVARTLVYTTAADGSILTGEGDTEDSFFREYRFKLEMVYDRFLTETGARLARERRAAAESFYQSIWAEVTDTLSMGRDVLKEAVR